MKPRIPMGAAILIATLFANSQSAQAYSYDRCDGEVIKWKHTTVMARVECSFPTFSDAEVAYRNAGMRWSLFTSLVDWNHYWPGCGAYELGNNYNETVLVEPSHIAPYGGLTTCRLSSCGFGANSEIEECDIEVANDYYFGAQDESFWRYDGDAAGRAVLLHEFGHLYGLKHTPSGLNIMRGPPAGSYQPHPLVGGNNCVPYPDEANGVRFLYPGGGSVTNLFSSAQFVDNGTIKATGQDSIFPVSPGTPLAITTTVGNNGTVTSNTNFRLFISNSPPPLYPQTGGTTTGTTLWSGTWLLSAGTTSTYTFQVTTPSVAPGYYWIYWTVNANRSLAESLENDNIVHSASSLYIQ